MNKNFSSLAKIIILGVFLSFGVGVIFAQWSGPTQPPFGGNVPAPINVGSDVQVKEGGLWADNFLATLGAVFASGGLFEGSVEIEGGDLILDTGRITIGGGSPTLGKVLVSQNSEGLAEWEELTALSCGRRQATASSARNLSVLCQPAGEPVGGTEIVTGGGGNCGIGTVVSSMPNSNLTGWELTCSQSGDISVYAVCCLVEPIQQVEPSPLP